MSSKMTTPALQASIGIVALRWSALLGFWFVLVGLPPWRGDLGAFLRAMTPDLVVGAIAATSATWVSLRIAPASGRRMSLVALARLVLQFVGQAFLAGVDVARRAFHPRVPLHPGVLRFDSRLVDANARAAFSAITSLVPGTLPIRHDDAAGSATGGDSSGQGTIVYHCLDMRAPIAASLRRDEAMLADAIGAACAPNAGSSDTRRNTAP